MNGNRLEELASEYYRIHGWIVMRNYWFRHKAASKRGPGWRDIDILAIKPGELLLVQVKGGINGEDKVRGVIEFFDAVDAHLKEGFAPDGKSDITWWKKGRKKTNIVIYEFSGSAKYVQVLAKAGIEPRDFKDIAEDIIAYIKNRKKEDEGVKEEIPSMRLLHYLYEKNLIRQ